MRRPVMTATTQTAYSWTKGSNVDHGKGRGSDTIRVSCRRNSVVDRDLNGFLPAGNFKACYVIQQIASACTLLQRLVRGLYPGGSPACEFAAAQYAVADASTVTNGLYPQFSWLPPIAGEYLSAI